MEKLKKINFRRMGASLVVGLSLVTGSLACKDKNAPSINNEKIVVDNPQGPSESGGAIINDLKAKGLYDMFNEHIAEMDRNAHVYVAHLTFLLEYLILAEEKGKEEFEEINQHPIFLQIAQSEEANKVLNPEILLEIAKDLDGGKKMQAALERLDQAKVLIHESCEAKEYVDGKEVRVEKDASADYEDQICFSATRILAKTSISSLSITLRSLFMHELTHKAGIKDEQKAQAIEALFWFLSVDKIQKHYWYVGSVDSDLNLITTYLQNILKDIGQAQSRIDILKDNYLKSIENSPYMKALRASENVELQPSKLKELWIEAWKSTYEKNWEHKVSLEEAADIMLIHSLRFDRSKKPDLPQTLLSVYDIQKKLYDENQKFQKYRLDQATIDKEEAFKNAYKIPEITKIVDSTYLNNELRTNERKTLDALNWVFHDLYHLYQFSVKNSKYVDYDNFIKGDKFEFCNYINSQAKERLFYNTGHINRICSDLFLDEIETTEEGVLFALRWLIPYAEASISEIFEDIKKRINNRQVFECSVFAEARCEDIIMGDRKDDDFYSQVEDLRSLKRKPSYEKVVSVFQNNLKWAIEYYKATYVENRGGKNE
ncbi:MAG: hypothetical protein VX642_12190 [Bdellovibrionota bacterium]|nr:hypothetical protein [Bdellovibrionota bacterium]